MAWIESTPSGERFKVAMAPRGVMLNAPASSGDLAAELLVFFLQLVVALAFVKDKTWKVGVFRAGPMKVRRCVYKQARLTQEQAEREVERLRECVRSGNPLAGR
jgi:hypothetical protein